VLVDEFGRGTNARDGAALLGAFVQHLATLPHPPRALIATHFLEALSMQNLSLSKHGELQGLDKTILFLQMSVQFAMKSTDDSGSTGSNMDHATAAGSKRSRPDSTDEDDTEVVPLYRLIPGVSDGSFGLHCAAKAGIQAALIQRAKEIVDRERKCVQPSATPIESSGLEPSQRENRIDD